MPYETEKWATGPYNEMQRPCIKRHSPYNVNMLFLDWSVQSKTIKQLWRLKWHKEWPADDPLPLCPDSMSDVPDPG
jgi:prepilin-type processing-associated H-X9-DG protein